MITPLRQALTPLTLPSRLWTPADISGVAEWFAVSRLVASDGDAVQTLTGQIASGSVTQATSSKRPTYQSGSGKPYLNFVSANAQVMSGSAVSSRVSPYSICMLIYLPSLQTNTLFVGGSNQGLGLNASGVYVSAFTQVTGTLTLNAWNSVVGIVNGASGKIRVNGIEVTGNTGSATYNGTTTLGSTAFNGRIADAAFINGVISAADMAAWDSWATRWTS